MSTRDRNEERGYGEESRTREEQDRAAEGGQHRQPQKVDEPRVPADTDAQGKLVDEASEDSFPASDPPSYWQREPNGDPATPEV